MATTSTYLTPGVYFEQLPSGTAPIAGVGTSTAGFVGVIPDQIPPTDPKNPIFTVPAKEGEVKLVTNFTEFKEAFGDLSLNNVGLKRLAHAVSGFFKNGGRRCWVTRVNVTPVYDANGVDKTVYTVSIEAALKLFEAIDEISIVAAPGLSSKDQTKALEEHCGPTLNLNRFAILDTAETFEDAVKRPTYTTLLGAKGASLPTTSDHAALYFPWVEVPDPSWPSPVFMPPSGHIAGLYARVDAQRGVHKAPANEPLFGVLGLKYAISDGQQGSLNPNGVNCIRLMDGSIRVWGARTVGTSLDKVFTYVNERRLFDYIRASIDQGTQWAVFEPNNPDLWAKITRNVSAFLTTVWAAGALFGDKPEQAFYVKCDAETNPPTLRENGQVTTEIGVALVAAAEFVIFRLGQMPAR